MGPGDDVVRRRDEEERVGVAFGQVQRGGKDRGDGFAAGGVEAGTAARAGELAEYFEDTAVQLERLAPKGRE